MPTTQLRVQPLLTIPMLKLGVGKLNDFPPRKCLRSREWVALMSSSAALRARASRLSAQVAELVLMTPGILSIRNS